MAVEHNRIARLQSELFLQLLSDHRPAFRNGLQQRDLVFALDIHLALHADQLHRDIPLFRPLHVMLQSGQHVVEGRRFAPGHQRDP